MSEMGDDWRELNAQSQRKRADQCPDSPRYRALGNSMAVPVMRWIGQQIDAAIHITEAMEQAT